LFALHLSGNRFRLSRHHHPIRSFISDNAQAVTAFTGEAVNQPASLFVIQTARLAAAFADD
jgi:hypothetical protein